MKKLTYKLWARIIACVSFVLVALVLFGSAIGIYVCLNQEWYSGNEMVFTKTNLFNNESRKTWNYLYDYIYSNYYDVSQDEFIQDLDEFSRGISEFRIILLDADDNILLDQTDDTMTLCWDGDFSIDQGTSESLLDFTMRLYLGSDLTVGGKLWQLRQFYAWMYANRMTFIWVAAAACVAELVLFIFCLCSAGHKAGEDGPVLIRQDKIPLDLHLAICIFLPLCVLVFIDEITYSSGGLFTLICLAVCFLIAASMGLAFVITFAARIKVGKWWENTICYRAWKIFCRIIKAVIKAAGSFIKLIPLTWKAILAYGCFIIINIFLAFVTYDEGSLFAAFFMVMLDLAVLVAVVYTSFQAKELYKAGKELANGKLDYVVDTTKMRYELKEHGEDLNSIGLGMSRAVDERMKSERLKTELITNVSHDLKTPLTSIVNYVDLLKKQPYGSPEAEEYVMVLDRQSAKLKKLTEDLVEASKASSGAISVDRQRINTVELVTQTLAEFESRFASANISPVLTVKTTHAEIIADGRLLWRVLDNLLQNVCKYAMPGTRAYFDIVSTSDRLTMVIKNISAEPLNIPAEELMERFVRGDESRSTEGTGLGLSIARSLTELMNGGFNISLDGDLFKAEISFAIAQ